MSLRYQMLLTLAWFAPPSGLHAYLNVDRPAFMSGVTQAEASLPQNSVAIEFNGKLTSKEVLKAFIAECGFSVA